MYRNLLQTQNCESLRMCGYNSHRGNPIATGTSWSTCSPARQIPWTRSCLLTPGQARHREAGQPDRRPPRTHRSAAVSHTATNNSHQNVLNIVQSGGFKSLIKWRFFWLQQCRKLMKAWGKLAGVFNKKTSPHAFKMRGRCVKRQVDL